MSYKNNSMFSTIYNYCESIYFRGRNILQLYFFGNSLQKKDNFPIT